MCKEYEETEKRNYSLTVDFMKPSSRQRQMKLNNIHIDCNNKNWVTLTEINKLLDGQGRRIELGIKVQHLLDVGEPDRVQTHLGFSLSSRNGRMRFGMLRRHLEGVRPSDVQVSSLQTSR